MCILEIKRIFMRRRFWMAFSLLMIAMLVDFMFTCFQYTGRPLSMVFSAYEYTILNNYIQTPVNPVFNILLPLIVSLMASDIYIEDHLLGMENMLKIRMTAKKYVQSQIMAIIIMVSVSVGVVLLANFILVLIAFPVQGYMTDLTTFKEFAPADSTRILSGLENLHPYMNLIVYAVIRIVFCVLAALLSYAVSTCWKYSRYVVCMFSFIFYFVYDLVTGQIHSEVLSTSILSVNGYGSIWMIVLFFVMEIAIIIGLIVRCIRKDTLT